MGANQAGAKVCLHTLMTAAFVSRGWRSKHSGQGGSILGKWSGKCQCLAVILEGVGMGVCVYSAGCAL